MVKIIALDDEELARDMLVDAIKEASPDAEINEFEESTSLLEYIGHNACDVAFLDIHVPGITGLELAQRLKERLPDINIIFVTGYNEYACDAMELHASGYIMKPVTAKKIEKELSDLRRQIAEKDPALLRVQCFGNFSVFDRTGTPIVFERSKAQEMLAYLIYRRGSQCTLKEIGAILFEDEPYTMKQGDYTRKIISSLRRTLTKYNAENAVTKLFNSVSVSVSCIDCDFYHINDSENNSLPLYAGEFMTQYSWAEEMVGYLSELAEKYRFDK